MPTYDNIKGLKNKSDDWAAIGLINAYIESKQDDFAAQDQNQSTPNPAFLKAALENDSLGEIKLKKAFRSFLAKSFRDNAPVGDSREERQEFLELLTPYVQAVAEKHNLALPADFDVSYLDAAINTRLYR
jgi:hypothetical protein